MAPRERQERLEHGRVRIEVAIGPVVPFLELFHSHSLGPKDHVAHIVEVPVTGEDPILLHVLFIDACSGAYPEPPAKG